MRTPIRKTDRYIRAKQDAYITLNKYQELGANLEKLEKIVRPRLAKEVKKYAEDGDFSENAAYQIAKGKLRGINQRILDIQDILKRAEIIETSDNSSVQLGCSVIVEVNGNKKTYQILGSTETDPAKGIISRSSPIGTALVNKRVGNVAEVKVGDKKIKYKIIEIK